MGPQTVLREAEGMAMNVEHRLSLHVTADTGHCRAVTPLTNGEAMGQPSWDKEDGKGGAANNWPEGTMKMGMKQEVINHGIYRIETAKPQIKASRRCRR